METILQPKSGQWMSLDELKQSGLFRQLSPARAAWMLAYLQGFLDTGIFNHRAATKAAYTCSNDDSVRRFGCAIKRSPTIQAVVQLFLDSWTRRIEFNREYLQQQVAEIQKHIDAADPGSTAAQRLIESKITLMHELQSLSKSGTAEPEATRPAKSPKSSNKFVGADPLARVPAGATPLADKNGVVKGYRTADGQFVQLADVEAE